MKLDQYVKQPLFWGWCLGAIWLAHVLFTLFTRQWQGLIISVAGLTAVALVLGAILSRRHKNLQTNRNVTNELS
jgi:hypothetical protein